ncbi:MAG: DUF327 family protein [Spirochaetes bacterium]|nr:DUF327 family protein [Spirochaetota bacterium]
MSKIDNEYSFFGNPQINKSKLKKSGINKRKILKNNNEFSFEDLIFGEEINFEKDQFAEKDKLIENYLKEIGKQGEKLKKSRHLKDLEIYKNLIKKFLLTAIDLIEKKEKKALWDKSKKQKITKIHMTIINQELQELTKIFFNEQKNILELAAKIDKIEGLIINLIS